MPAVDPKTTTTSYLNKNPKMAYLLQENWWDKDTGEDAQQYALAELLNYKSLFVKTYIEQRRFGAVYSDKQYDFISSNMNFNRTQGKRLLSLNVVASCIDTLTSRICANNPTVQYLAEGGDISAEERAQNLEFVVQKYQQKKRINKYFHQCFKDGSIFGTGIIHMRQHNVTDQYILENVKPYELFFDMNDAAYGNLYNFQVARAECRYTLMKEYPDKLLTLQNATTISAVHLTNSTIKDTVTVVYAYNLLAHKMLVYCDAGFLAYEDFKLGDDPIYGQSPLMIMRYETDERNFFGVGIAEKIFSNQIELNKLVRSAQRATQLMSVPKILYNTACGPIKSSFNTEIGGLIQWSGNIEPKPITLGQVPVDLFRQIDSWYQRSYQEIGISEMSAQSQLPANLESGKSISTYYHIESKRFQMTGQRYEELIIDFNNLFVSFLNKSIEQSRVPDDLQYVYGRDRKKLSIESISLKHDEFVIVPFPISDMPTTPADKLSQAQNMVNMGQATPKEALKLFQIPDINNYRAFNDSEYDYIMKQISNMAKGQPAEPMEINNLQMAADLSNKGYFFYNNRGLDPKYLALIAQYNASALTGLKMQQDQLMQQQMAQQMQAQAQMQQVQQQSQPTAA